MRGEGERGESESEEGRGGEERVRKWGREERSMVTSLGLPSKSLTLFSHSWTLCGFCLNKTLLRRNGLRSISSSNLARRSSRSRSSVPQHVQ